MSDADRYQELADTFRSASSYEPMPMTTDDLHDLRQRAADHRNYLLFQQVDAELREQAAAG